MIQGALLNVLNHLLAQAGWAHRHLHPFAGRTARFIIPPWQLGLAIGAGGFFEEAVGDTDVTVTLPAQAPLLLFQGLDRLLAEAHVVGNAEFATALSFVLRNLRWDAEEDLSRLLGDVVATRVVGLAGSLASWQRRTASKLVENLAAYLGEDAGFLTPSPELLALRKELAEVDERLTRLMVRVAAL